MKTIANYMERNAVRPFAAPVSYRFNNASRVQFHAKAFNVGLIIVK